MKKKQIKNYDIHELIKHFSIVEKKFAQHFPNASIDFGFSKLPFKKYDTEHMKKIKLFSALLDEFTLVIQEFRSRGFSLIQISDYENEQSFIKNSFVERTEK